LRSIHFIAKTISYLFHPLLLPTIGLLILFNHSEMHLWVPEKGMQHFLLAFTFCLTFLLPLLHALLLIKMKQITSLSMPTKEERRMPYLATTILYSIQLYFVMKMELPTVIKALMLSATFLAAAILVINTFWKISAHMAGMGALTGIMIALSYRLQINLLPLMVVLFLLSGLVAFARLYLNAHSTSQVYVGFILGMAMQCLLFLK
jgi:membrane-associated phospholipid phosphatase